MSVLIKGMEMPKACYACKLLNVEFWECRVLGNASHSADCRPADCPLVPVPPHGRLIDADALCATHKEVCSRSMKFNLDLAPTIIPASEEAE